jgi:hypothetical protein
MIVDIENALSKPNFTTRDARMIRKFLTETVSLKDHEQVTIGTSHINAFETTRAWSNARVRYRSGPNGADLVLLDVLTNEGIEERFDEVVLVSGDGIFTDQVNRLRSLGINVTLVAPANGCATRLRLRATSSLRYSPPWEPTTRGAA